MAALIIRSEDEIYAQAEKASNIKYEYGRSRWPGMSYEDGVENALLWVLGGYDDAPMDDE